MRIISSLEPKDSSFIIFTQAMAFLGDPIERLEKPTGAVRCNKDLIEEALFERRRDLFTEVLDPPWCVPWLVQLVRRPDCSRQHEP
jgi:hypothetical protein